MEAALKLSQLNEQDILHSDSTCYQIIEFKGQGCYGKVAKCLNLSTTKMVAVKILKEDSDMFIEDEVEMLEAVRTLDPDKKNIVRFMESFSFQNLSCLVFEMLDRSLWDLIDERKGNPMDLNEIRPVTHQLLVAFDGLKSLGIIHSDLKPDNVMLVNHKDQPFKIKLIDFGVALPESEAETGSIIQPASYRAPEVTLGLPLSTAVDMWGVGCVMAHMYFGRSIFPYKCPYKWMQVMLHLLGQPDNWPLDSGIYTQKYFIWEDDPTNPGWRLRTPEEYEDVTGVKPKGSSKFLHLAKDLEDAVQSRPTNGDPMELKDRQAFLSLLKCCLRVNSEEGITPREAMNHSFVTMVHLVDDMKTSIYADTALQLMTVSPLCHLDERDDSLDAEIATNDEASEDLSENFDYSNSATMDETPTANFLHEDECGTDKNSDIESLFGSDFTTENSLPSFNHEDETEPESPHSAQREPSTDMSSQTCSGIAASFNRDNTNTDILSVTSNTNRASADVDPTGGAAASISSKDEAAAATRPTGADDVKTGPDGAQRKTIFRRTRKFFGRVRKRLLSIFICGKIESDD